MVGKMEKEDIEFTKAKNRACFFVILFGLCIVLFLSGFKEGTCKRVNCNDSVVCFNTENIPHNSQLRNNDLSWEEEDQRCSKVYEITTVGGCHTECKLSWYGITIS